MNDFPMRRILSLTMLAALCLTAAACDRQQDPADAYGNFEATEIRVSAEVGGRLLSLTAEEGHTLAAGEVVAQVDTASLLLERAQLEAERQATRSRTATVDAQQAVLTAQRQLAESELARFTRLAADQAATAQQIERAASEVEVLSRRVREIASQRPVIADQVAALDARLAQLDDRIGRATVVNPTAGTVLALYAEAEELIAAGQPIYDLADLSVLELRAYVSGAQLPELSLGQQVEVAIDRDADTERRLPGTISWISSQAEFTPSTLQTKEERVDLVYAVKIEVANPDGRLKIGMPGEVRWRAATGTATAESPATATATATTTTAPEQPEN